MFLQPIQHSLLTRKKGTRVGLLWSEGTSAVINIVRWVALEISSA